jgi:D-aspartate ligase
MDRSHDDGAGALVIGGDYCGLGVVRSLGRKGIPVWVLEGGRNIAGFSRYAVETVPWPDSTADRQVDYLLALGEKHRLDGWMLFPTTNRVAALLARHRERLMTVYLVTSPAWESIHWACDKRLAYELAASVGLSVPRTYYPENRNAVESLDCEFPVILKSGMDDGGQSFTRIVGRQLNDRQALLSRYDETCMFLKSSRLVIQELVRGNGDNHFSYAGLWLDGNPVVGLVAQHIRQYPGGLGWFSTLVETAHKPEVEEASRRMLSATRYTGLVEVEYKYDRRDNQLKVLDVSPRVWSWHTLGRRAGIDFPFLLWLMVRGEPIPDFLPPRAGVRWSYFLPDTLSAVGQIRSHKLSVGEYLRSIHGSREPAIFAEDDPQPSFSGRSILLHRRLLGSRRHQGRLRSLQSVLR